MNTQQNLPGDVKAAIHANRKIDAIKRLREHRGLGLKEAKHAVDAYAAENRHLIAEPESSGGGLQLVAVVIVVAVALYFVLQ